MATLLVLAIQMSEPICWDWFWGRIANPKEKRKKYRILGLLVMCANIPAVSFFAGLVEGIPVLTFAINNLSIFTNVFYALIFYVISKEKALGYVLAMAIIGPLMEYVVTITLIVGMHMKQDMIVESTSTMIICLIILRVLNFCALIIFWRLRTKYKKSLENRKTLSLVVVGYLAYFISFGMCYCVFDVDLLNFLSVEIAIILSLEGAILSFAVFQTIEGKKVEEKYIENMRYTEKQLQLFSDTQKKMDANQKLLHDMGNHLCTIVNLAENNKCKEIITYTSELLTEIKSGTAVGMSNSVISVILYAKKIKANEKRIHLVCGIEVDNLKIPLMDLNSILTNMLDNAIEACEKIVNWKKREIVFKIVITGNNVVIECENTYVVKPVIQKDGYICTSKADKINHGFGLRRIEECAERNGGVFQFGYSEKVFGVKVLFDKEKAIIEEE